MKLYLFDRMDKLIHFEDLSVLTLKREIKGRAAVTMSQNEIFVLQLAAVSDCDDVIKNITSSGKCEVECINTDVTDKFANRKKLEVKLRRNIFQPLFFTIKAEQKGKREEKEKIIIEAQSGKYEFELLININDTPVVNHGYNDLWRLSRISWLNSDLYMDESIVKPYVPVCAASGRLYVIGREIELAENGMIRQVYSKFNEEITIENEVQRKLFAKEMSFEIGDAPLPDGKTRQTVAQNRIESVTVAENEAYKAEISSILRYEGMLEYKVKITPKKDFTAHNVSLNFFVAGDCSSLMHGLGMRANSAQPLSFKWDEDKQQDCIFIGAVNCGMRVKFKAENYRRPLVNIFYKNLPLIVPSTTWDNNSNGGIKVEPTEKYTKISAYTGEFEFKKGEMRSFDFELHITPLKPIDYKKAFSVRYCHNSRLKNELKEVDTAEKNGLNYVIFHQGNMIMPFINYPFYETDRLRSVCRYAKSKGIGVKLYYTEREHSNHMAETFVYKALGDEIILRKQGVSHSWQKEKPQWLVDNFGEDIIPGWFVKYKHGKYKNDHDISFIVRPDTRLDNYYIEGLRWLVENVGISGIYIDDTSLDRTTLERAKKALRAADGLIDMHMWNHEEPRAGDVSCMNLYTELLPFLDSVWLGEGFFYKKYSPEYMLAEVSGIPYGLTGQMLEGGGDFYIGMLYGMNNRFNWGYTNAVDMYKLWDDFGIENSRMLGYWHSESPVGTGNENVLATVYKKKKSALICLYNFAFEPQSFSVNVNEELLGFKPESVREMRFGKKSRRADISKPIKLKKRTGIIFEVSEA